MNCARGRGANATACVPARSCTPALTIRGISGKRLPPPPKVGQQSAPRVLKGNGSTGAKSGARAPAALSGARGAYLPLRRFHAWGGSTPEAAPRVGRIGRHRTQPDTRSMQRKLSGAAILPAHRARAGGKYLAACCTPDPAAGLAPGSVDAGRPLARALSLAAATTQARLAGGAQALTSEARHRAGKRRPEARGSAQEYARAGGHTCEEAQTSA